VPGFADIVGTGLTYSQNGDLMMICHRKTKITQDLKTTSNQSKLASAMPCAKT